jgi:hypothetical protein
MNTGIQPNYNLVQDSQMSDLGAKVFCQRFGKEVKSEAETLAFLQNIGLATSAEVAQSVVQSMTTETVAYWQLGPLEKRFQLVRAEDSAGNQGYQLRRWTTSKGGETDM